jgi:signal peptidase
MKKIKTLGQILYWLVLVVLIIISGFTVLSSPKISGSYRLMVVLSGSMEPKIHTGSIVFVKPTTDYKKGDVISFSDSQDSSISTTHRINDIINKDGEVLYTTKGDANNIADSNQIKKSQIIGKEYFSIPYIGYVVNFAKTQLGLIVLIIIPTSIIVYSELVAIKTEIVKLVKKKKHEKTSD